MIGDQKWQYNKQQAGLEPVGVYNVTLEPVDKAEYISAMRHCL